jgi:hypothetical protein
MSQEFFKSVEDRYSDRNFKEKWDQKCNTFFDNFIYLNSEVLIEDQVQKLTHVGIKSIANSGLLIQKMTSENLDMMQDQLGTVIKDISVLSGKFDLLEKAIKSRTGLFSSKTPTQVFFETFKNEERIIRQQINELNLKGHSLEEVKNNLEHNIEQLIDCYALLGRDLRFIKQAEEKLGNHEKALVAKVFNKNLFDITNIKSDLLTHQQILFQKFAGVKILLQNILNCNKNINYISRVTYSAVMNVVELQQIIALGQSKLDEKQTQALVKAKEALLLVTTDLKIVAATPFAVHAT